MSSVNTAYRPAEVDQVRQRALRILKGTATFDDRFVPDHIDLIRLIETLRTMGCKIAFVTGVWDLWHIGHAQYIQKGKEEAARKYPDAEHIVLVVGVDTDAFTRERKGPDRPIVPEEERCGVLGYQRAVDIISLQYEEDQLFQVVAHDVRIVSQSTEDLPELERIQAQCEYIVNLPPQATTSTTARIRRLMFDGAIETFKKIEHGLTSLLEEVRSGIGK